MFQRQIWNCVIKVFQLIRGIVQIVLFWLF